MALEIFISSKSMHKYFKNFLKESAMASEFYKCKQFLTRFYKFILFLEVLECFFGTLRFYSN